MTLSATKPAVTSSTAIDIDHLRSELKNEHPSLHVITVDGGYVIRGAYAINHSGTELDRFIIEIDLRRDLISNLPLVREIGGRIPQTIDRHINPNGSCCVCLPEDYFLRHPGRFEILEFLNGPIRSFFVGQALVERGGAWPHGELAHGHDGREQWLKDFFKSLTSQQLRAYLEILSVAKIKGHLTCPCGSGKRLRTCHFALLLQLGSILSPEGARERLNTLSR